jgi:hypothetical protein
MHRTIKKEAQSQKLREIRCMAYGTQAYGQRPIA